MFYPLTSSANTCGFQMNQLQSELRLARSIVEEKDAEIQRIRNANNQVCFKML